MSIWDSPELASGGDYIRFDQPGDSVTGTVIDIRLQRWDDGTVSPQLILDTDDGEKTVTAGQVRLKAALAEQKPEKGDRITITYTSMEKRAGGRTLKHWDVSVIRAGDPAAAKPAAPAAAPQPPAAAPAAANGLNPEQQAALKAAGLI